MDTEIELLKKQIALAHEIIGRLSKENIEYRLLLNALMLSHENTARLITEIDAEKERALSAAVYKPLPDGFLEHLQKTASQAISLVRSRRNER